MAIRPDVDIAPARDTLGVGGDRAGHTGNNLLDLPADLLDDFQVRAGHLDADRGLDTSRQHIDTCLDRHDPGVRHAGKFHRGVELLDEFLCRHAFTPLVSRLELDERLDHRQRRGIGCRIGATDFSEHLLHFGDRPDETICLLQQFLCLANREPRKRGRHVHQVTLVEFRHELGTQPGRKTREPGCVPESLFPLFPDLLLCPVDAGNNLARSALFRRAGDCSPGRERPFQWLQKPGNATYRDN